MPRTSSSMGTRKSPRVKVPLQPVVAAASTKGVAKSSSSSSSSPPKTYRPPPRIPDVPPPPPSPRWTGNTIVLPAGQYFDGLKEGSILRIRKNEEKGRWVMTSSKTTFEEKEVICGYGPLKIVLHPKSGDQKALDEWDQQWYSRYAVHWHYGAGGKRGGIEYVAIPNAESAEGLTGIGALLECPSRVNGAWNARFKYDYTVGSESLTVVATKHIPPNTPIVLDYGEEEIQHVLSVARWEKKEQAKAKVAAAAATAAMRVEEKKDGRMKGWLRCDVTDCGKMFPNPRKLHSHSLSHSFPPSSTRKRKREDDDEEEQ